MRLRLKATKHNVVVVIFWGLFIIIHQFIIIHVKQWNTDFSVSFSVQICLELLNFSFLSQGLFIFYHVHVLTGAAD